VEGDDVAVIDQQLTYQAVEDRLAHERDPILRRNLALVLEHMLAEVALDVDRLMGTLCDDPHYHFRSGPARGEYHGRDEVRAFYETFAKWGTNRLQTDPQRVVVDRDMVVTEGLQRIAFPGRTLAMRGIEVDDPDAEYLFEAWKVIMWPIDGSGLLIGEDAYFGADGFRGIERRKLGPGDVRTVTPEQVRPRRA
jgi:hypothetical protein